MPFFNGNTSTGATSTAMDLSYMMRSFSIVNKTGSTANISVAFMYGSTVTQVYKGTLNGNASYRDSTRQLLPANYKIYFLTDQNCDFFFTLE